MSNNRRRSSNSGRKSDNSTASPTDLDAMRSLPHFEVTLTPRTNMDTIIDTLLEACSGLFPGERPTIVLDHRHCLALISVSEHQVERLQYKSWIEHRSSGQRYNCRFREGTLGVPQKRVSVGLPGAKYAFLKSQQHVRDYLKKSDPLIRAHWQPVTGAEDCFVHLHYSSDEPALLAAVDELRRYIETEASKVLLASLPLQVPPCDRYALSVDNGFRKVAYDHNVSPWTRTQRDSPLGPEWCTFATDTMEKMTATIEAYKEFARMNPQFNLKVLGQAENSMKTYAKPRPSRKSNRSSGHTSPVAPSSPPSNSPIESLDHIPMAPVMHMGPQVTHGYFTEQHIPTGVNHRGLPQYVPQQAANISGFGPRHDRSAPARFIAANGVAYAMQSPPSPTPMVNANLPSDLPPGLNVQAANCVPGAGVPAASFQSLLSGLEPLRFPTMAPAFPTSTFSDSTSNAFAANDDVWGKFSPPSDSFIPSITSINTSNGGFNPTLSFSDFFITPNEEGRLLALTDSTGLSG